MLVAHIEKGGCRRMDAELLDQLREKKMEFTKGLKQMTNEPIKHDFSVYLPSHAYTRARNEFDEQQTRRLAGASPPSYDAPSSSNAFNRAWPNVSGAQDDSYSSHSSNWGIPNIMDAEIKHAKTPNMSPDAKSTKHSNEDIPSITDTEVDDLKPAYQHSMPAHLAGQQQLPDPKASPWDQKPTGLQHRSDSPWSQKPAGLQHRPESRCSTLLSGPQQRSNAQTPSGDQNVTWGQKLFPNASPAKRPTEKQLDAAYKPSEKQKHRLMDPDSPEHPNFNPAKYRSPYSGKFVCPKQGCG